jgi:hypothetical protein
LPAIIIALSAGDNDLHAVKGTNVKFTWQMGVLGAAGKLGGLTLHRQISPIRGKQTIMAIFFANSTLLF